MTQRLSIATPILGVGILILAMFTVVAAQSTGQSPVAISSWQHLAMPVEGDTFSTPAIARKINQIGNDGWENRAKHNPATKGCRAIKNDLRKVG